MKWWMGNNKLVCIETKFRFYIFVPEKYLFTKQSL